MAGRLGGAKVGGGGEHGTALGLSTGAIQLVVAKSRRSSVDNLNMIVDIIFAYHARLKTRDILQNLIFLQESLQEI